MRAGRSYPGRGLAGPVAAALACALAGCAAQVVPGGVDPLSARFYARHAASAADPGAPVAAPGPGAPAADAAPVPDARTGAMQAPHRRAGRGDAALERGIALLHAGDPREAHRAFVRAIRTSPDKAAALNGAGLAAEAQGMVHLARRYFEAAAAAAPRSDVAHTNLGVALFRLGDPAGAAAAFAAAARLSEGKNAAAVRNLALAEQVLSAGRPRPPSALVTHRVDRLGPGHYRLSAHAVHDGAGS